MAKELTALGSNLDRAHGPRLPGAAARPTGTGKSIDKRNVRSAQTRRSSRTSALHAASGSLSGEEVSGEIGQTNVRRSGRRSHKGEIQSLATTLYGEGVMSTIPRWLAEIKFVEIEAHDRCDKCEVPCHFN